MTNPALAKPTDNGRFYVHPTTRAEVPSITNILGKKFKPLWNAGAKEAARYASENIGRLTSLTPDEIFALVSRPPRRDDSPSAIGDIVHGMIENYISDTPMSLDALDASLRTAPQTAKWMFQRFIKFNEQYAPRYTATEFTVWSTRYNYAGTADFSAYVNGRHVLADTKTGQRIYPEVAMQLAAIQNADFMIDAQGNEHEIPKYDAYAALHLRPRSFTFHPILNIDQAFRSFLALREVFEWDVTYAPTSVGFAPQHN